ncbi:hypothetical protein AND_002694 [Anopheles darlingi]|uniref:Secreted protein n=1 Tax=Anopheles darlingi TaxID=43151 RepID=W5JN03_ANODA|nr:hypothetical protein AND_002694 [Anopheles darlingi]
MKLSKCVVFALKTATTITATADAPQDDGGTGSGESRKCAGGRTSVVGLTVRSFAHQQQQQHQVGRWSIAVPDYDDDDSDDLDLSTCQTLAGQNVNQVGGNSCCQSTAADGSGIPASSMDRRNSSDGHALA